MRQLRAHRLGPPEERFPSLFRKFHCVTFPELAALDGAKRRPRQKRRLTYLKWISLCDVFVSLSYIAIMCVQVYVDYFHSLFLFYMWHTYLVIAYTISHITFSSSSYLLMAATIERYLQTTANNRSTALFHCLRSHRAFVVLFCFLAGFVLRGTVFFEIEVQTTSACQGFASMWAAPASLTSYPLFDKIWKFWIRKLLTVILPFVVLAYFNVAIVMNVRKSDRDQIVKTLILYVTVGPRGDSTRLSSRLRTVTRMLVIVVCTYLFSNVIDVIIAIMENLDWETLEGNPEIYTVASDISSFLPILACAIRPVIYATNDSIIAREIRRSFARLCGCSRHARELPELLAVHDSPSDKLNLEPRFGMGRLIMARAALDEPKHSFISVSSVLL
ncbi:hypothetical protein PRIPAC_82746 [Pristionchus pacificus]|uniref:G_PROTEIN_RECEP_F1_2 domain-containing protein n=1 Tax=Pristionchus pacificus TaxID=54126 RepID=A0A2A6BHU8_PRIPA|nr:hypothetical protein PRIPAC_82746 [Pristionchus pacificus]|eukprot:PDM65406.1 hypothetical protein PRIPAC_52348 [Pristionchus pacificus]